MKKKLGTVLLYPAIFGLICLPGLAITSVVIIGDASRTGSAMQAWAGLAMFAVPAYLFIGTALLAIRLNPDLDPPQPAATGGPTP